MIIRKFISSLSNKEKGELIRALADVAYKGKGIVFDYLYELAGFIENEPDVAEEKGKYSPPQTMGVFERSRRDRQIAFNASRRSPIVSANIQGDDDLTNEAPFAKLSGAQLDHVRTLAGAADRIGAIRMVKKFRPHWSITYCKEFVDSL